MTDRSGLVCGCISIALGVLLLWTWNRLGSGCSGDVPHLAPATTRGEP